MCWLEKISLKIVLFTLKSIYLYLLEDTYIVIQSEDTVLWKMVWMEHIELHCLVVVSGS